MRTKQNIIMKLLSVLFFSFCIFTSVYFSIGIFEQANQLYQYIQDYNSAQDSYNPTIEI